MTIFVKDNVGENFVKIIPAFVIKRIRDKSSGIRYKKMDNYLQKNFKVSLEDVIQFLKNRGFSYNKVKHTYMISINNNIVEKKSGLKLDALVKLIDYGNKEIKGIHLINDAMEYVSNNLLNIYRYLTMKGEQK